MSAHALSTRSLDRLNLDHEPVAVAFLDAPPPGLARAARPDAASCGYWKQASEGKAFYTTPDDHQNCPIGAFTHGVTLAAEKTQELNQLVGTMIELKYLRDEEVPMIPHRTDPLQFAAYSPLARAPFAPDIVVFRGNARQIMLISEAARRAATFDQNAPMGRPACSLLPQAMGSHSGVVSVGCIGNRVYTGLGDDELYLAVPGSAIEQVLGELNTIIDANNELEKFHMARAQQLRG